jgi:hypothetical protein
MNRNTNCSHYAERPGVCKEISNKWNPCKGIKNCPNFKKKKPM